jgi:transcription-repair coupling factor (superfamily II helicase)
MSISDFKSSIGKTSLLSKSIKVLENSGKLHLKGVVGSLYSFFIHELQHTFKTQLFITDTDEQARIFKADLSVISEKEIIYFPSTNHKPYDRDQILDSSLLVQRSEAIQAIQSSKSKIVVTSAEALFDKVAPPSQINDVSIHIKRGNEIDPENFRLELVQQAYKLVRFVDQPGEFAVRGGIIDVFPFSGEYPIRLELFGDEVDSIREFDANSQRSISFLDEIKIIPDLSNLPDLDKESLLSYFDESTLILLKDAPLIESVLNTRFDKAEDAFTESKQDNLEPNSLFLSNNEFHHQLATFKTSIYLGSATSKKIQSIIIESKPQPDFHGNFDLLKKDVESNSEKGIKTVICCDNEGQVKRFNELLGPSTPPFDYELRVNSLYQGFIFPEIKRALYTDHQIFNRYYRPKVKRRIYSGGISFKELKDLSVGDFVVHVDYGIGQFAGFKTIQVKNSEQEVVILRYKDDSLLYVNVSSLHKLQKYSGKEGTAPRITKLGSGEWARKKAQTKRKVKDIARELILLYAKRKSQKAHAFAGDSGWQIEMEARFEYEETPDQHEAILAVKQDMETKQPMDRLVCGDVGFGKTEVAVRAAFKAVMDQKQVGVLVPTTILAEQHAKTFLKRMKNFPIRIEVLSRFRTKAQQTQVIKELKEGKVDIVIGTHRILSKDVHFKDLGLIVVDEEQRFGVSAKEKLKEFRATVDVLTLTATPIPRTLQYSLMGARDLSVINTPPPNRRPVYTEIHSFNEALIRDAILQEMSRGGQVFFVHNRVKNIEEIAEMIRFLVPNVRVRFGHGQMTASQLEKIIEDFYSHKFDVLVSTNIIENGIDIANANTILINNADNFGLAELHQLRGRVGRSNRKAFCYLITRPIETLTTEARKRLLALEEFSDLGSGFNIAMRDLDIRGAGDILGGEQSGFINDIGFDLYTKILNDAVRELKESEFADLFEEVETELEFPETQVEIDDTALLPTEYILDNVERLNLYRKLSQAKSEPEIDEWKEEIMDRFGKLPIEAEHLILVTKIKLFASKSFFIKATVRAGRMWLICPKAESNIGAYFYNNNLFQQILKKLETIKKDKFQLIQKNEVVRFAIQDIPNYKAAYSFLKKLSEA